METVADLSGTFSLSLYLIWLLSVTAARFSDERPLRRLQRAVCGCNCPPPYCGARCRAAGMLGPLVTSVGMPPAAHTSAPHKTHHQEAHHQGTIDINHHLHEPLRVQV